MTPNLQHFMAPIGIEGLFTSSVVTLATALSEGDVSLLIPWSFSNLLFHFTT